MVNFGQMDIDLQTLQVRLNLENFALDVLDRVLINNEINLSNQHRETLNSLRIKQVSIIDQVEKDLHDLIIMVSCNMDDDGNPLKTFES